MDYIKPVPGQDMINALVNEKCIVMATNIRVIHSTRGIMMAAKELDAAVMFEIAKSEIKYTGQSPKAFVDMIVKTAKELEFNQPYVIHGDHIGVKTNTPEAIGDSAQLIRDQISAGFTSFAIDASHNFDVNAPTVLEQLKDNIEITTQLAKLIPDDAGLEVEVGEVGKKDPVTGEKSLTSVEEAETYVKAIKDAGFSPNLLATNNGTAHGNTYDAEGNLVEQIGIDIPRTKSIADAIKPYGVYVAQHGITGTPLNMMQLLINAGVYKGNVGTNWQNIALTSMPENLVKRMEEWTLTCPQAIKMKAKKPGIKENELLGKCIKNSIVVFKDEIDALSGSELAAVDEATKQSALAFFKAFNAVGTASKVKQFIEE